MSENTQNEESKVEESAMEETNEEPKTEKVKKEKVKKEKPPKEKKDKKAPKMKKCSACHEEIPKKAKICPHCGSEHTYLRRGNEFLIKEIAVWED